MSSSVQKAILLASEAHADDKWGNSPYMTHLALAADNVVQIMTDAGFSTSYEYEDMVQAAWLHDVIEDHPEFENRVRDDFPQIYESLLLVARDRNDTYAEFIQKIIDSGDEVALVVKIADMRSNMNNNPPANLRKRYESNIEKLENALRNFYQ